MPPIRTEDLRERALMLLRRFYGYSSFRPGQWEVIQALCNGRDAVVLMPTGGGKSLCYQLPALIAPRGCAVVVSPLIALMNDQVAGLVANGIPAAAVHSNQDEASNREIMEAVGAGKIKLLYISPERLLADMDRWNRQLPVSLFAIDEAHCISQWGHDFRPVYTSLKLVKEKWPSVPVVALTATADRMTRDDIVAHLGLRNPFCYLGSFDRPNLSLRVYPNPGLPKRVAYICGLVRKYPNDCGIVYCLSRKNAENMTRQLQARGIRVACYHAGMSPEQRRLAQRAFANGSVQAVCATVAFGMGIDKSNIRWVVHNNLPANIESYYQEIGRAGRDGLPAEATLFYSYADIITHRQFIEGSGRQAVNTEKLRRMESYARARVCRRRILLSYFSEEMVHDCGNCDVCINPPHRFDGTVTAQKALSAAMRTGQRVGIFTLVDILRGSGRADIRRQGFDTIKTFGAGADLSQEEWMDYVGQMIQLGLFEIAYDKGNRLHVTPYGERVLYGRETIELSRYVPLKNATEEAAALFRPEELASADEKVSKSLFEQLKAVRMGVARREKIPAYRVFTDASLQDMAARKPLTMEQFLNIHGVGEKKAGHYAETFITAIRRFQGLEHELPEGQLLKRCLLLFNEGSGVGSIARELGLTDESVRKLLARLIEENFITHFGALLTPADYKTLLAILEESGRNLAEASAIAESRGHAPGLMDIALAIHRANH